MEPNLLIPQYSNIESLLGIFKSVIKVFTLKTSHAPFVIVLYSTVALDLATIFCLSSRNQISHVKYTKYNLYPTVAFDLAPTFCFLLLLVIKIPWTNVQITITGGGPRICLMPA